MGLTTWKNAPRGKILKSDVTVAKNYLNEAEMDKLNRLVALFIDFAELRALNRQVMAMKDWLGGEIPESDRPTGSAHRRENFTGDGADQSAYRI